jgi:hypothetical protein
MAEPSDRKTVADELHDLSVQMYEQARREEGTASPERLLALGIASGAIGRARGEWLRPPLMVVVDETGRKN